MRKSETARAKVMKWNGIWYKWATHQLFSNTLMHTCSFTGSHSVALLSAAIELTSYTKQFLWWMDIRERERVDLCIVVIVRFLCAVVLHLVCSYFLYVLLFYFILFYFLFCFCVLQFTSAPMSCRAVICHSLFDCLISKRVFLFPPYHFYLSSLLAQHRKITMYFIGCAFFLSLSLSFPLSSSFYE